MAKNSKNNHTISFPTHPAILYLDWAINANLKKIPGDAHIDIFEDFAEIHELGKATRSHHLYITTEEVVDYIVKHNPNSTWKYGEEQV